MAIGTLYNQFSSGQAAETGGGAPIISMAKRPMISFLPNFLNILDPSTLFRINPELVEWVDKIFIVCYYTVVKIGMATDPP